MKNDISLLVRDVLNLATDQTIVVITDDIGARKGNWFNDFILECHDRPVLEFKLNTKTNEIHIVLDVDSENAE